MQLKDKVAIITGGGTGLGRSITLQLAQEGTHVIVNYSRSKEEAEKTAQEARSYGITALAVKADVSDPSEGETLIHRAEEEFGRLDILVNNAGTTKYVPFADLQGLNPDDWLKLFKTNAMSNFFLARAAVPLMNKNGGGCILNTVSVAGIRPSGSSIAYAVSKAAQIHLTKCLAVTLAPTIRVNGVAPGLLLTRWSAGFTPEHIKAMEENAPLKKTPSVEETASAYIYLAKNESITGQIIAVDAGTSIYYR
ncbi:MAG TPA: SDR family oxidoreductase [Spirochaetales bacterium]|nr:SDR family oxidoreductase [Spirochaetales bacterium]HOV37228.1 SDR family oxidoreductase [Spirochaetales bacterium]